MGRVQLRKDLYLLLDIFYFIFCALEVNDLDGDGFLGPLVVPLGEDRMESERNVRETYPLKTSPKEPLPAECVSRLPLEGMVGLYRSCLVSRRIPLGLVVWYPGMVRLRCACTEPAKSGSPWSSAS